MSETVIQVTSLGKRIKGKTILEDISFEINQGDCVALIGPNGAGKTVLMSCILGDKKPSSGQVLIDGKAGKAKPIRKIPLKRFHCAKSRSNKS